MVKLTFFFRKFGRRLWIAFISFRMGIVADPCEHGNELSASIKVGNYLNNWTSVSFSRVTLSLELASKTSRCFRLPAPSDTQIRRTVLRTIETKQKEDCGREIGCNKQKTNSHGNDYLVIHSASFYVSFTLHTYIYTDDCVSGSRAKQTLHSV